MTAHPLLRIVGIFTWLPLMVCGCMAEGWSDFSYPDPDDGAFSIEVAASDYLPTIATVTWTVSVDEVEGAFVEYVLDGHLPGFVSVVPEDDEFSCTLLGLKPNSEYTISAVVDTSGSRLESTHETFVTGSLPSAFPGPEFTVDEEVGGHGGFLVTTVNSDDSAAVIFDRDGDIVWWYTDIDQFSTRAVLSHDGETMLIARGASPDDIPAGGGMVLVRVKLDGSGEESIAVTDLHHDFVELPDGSVAYLGMDMREVEGFSSPVQVDRIVEMSPDGVESREVWSAWGQLTFDPDNVFENDGSAAVGWPHANAIDYYPETDTYGVSLYLLDLVVFIDRQTGEVEWQIGRNDSDFALSSSVEAGRFGPQHQFDLQGDSLLVFNNGEPEDFESQAIEYTLDFDTATAETSAAYSSSPPIYNPVFGDASYLPNGNWLVTWSTAGLIEEVSPQGDLVSRLSLPMGTAFGYTTFVDELYPNVEQVDSSGR